MKELHWPISSEIFAKNSTDDTSALHQQLGIKQINNVVKFGKFVRKIGTEFKEC